MFEAYPEWERTLASLQLIAFMLGMGFSLAVSDFAAVLRRPRSFLIALIGQVLVIPFLAVLINHLGKLEPGIAVGLILVSAMPGGTLAKMFTYLGRGNVALSITLSVVSTLLALVTVPVTLNLLAAEHLPEDFAMPIGAIMMEVFLFVLLPLGGGLLLSRVMVEQRRKIARWSVRFGFVIVVIMVTGSIGSGRIHPASYGLGVPAAIILFCLVGMQINMIPFYLLPLPRADRMAAGIEVTMRNMILALLLYASLFSRDEAVGPGVLFVILFYAAAAMGAGLPLALNHRRMWRRECTAAAGGAEI